MLSVEFLFSTLQHENVIMSEKNTVRYKSKNFAIRVVRLYQYLTQEKGEFILSKQLLKSGTSIGANLAESQCAISKKDFFADI